MNIGYPCINESIRGTCSSTFRLASFTPERLLDSVARNLACLQQILEFNVTHQLCFFRMSSGLVPFASHPVNTVPWQDHFRDTLRQLGTYIRSHHLRISMHPDQFVVLNSPSPQIVDNSIRELAYQGSIMDLMNLDASAKLQIHGGGVYGDKAAAIRRFVDTYNSLPDTIRARLVLENDDRLYSLRDCLQIHEATGIPILFDNFHHECLNHGEPMAEALQLAARTWQPHDGVMMVDYSSQAPGERKGKHTQSITLELFREFLSHLNGLEVDIMLEIKDKEASALQALGLLQELGLVKKKSEV